MIKGHVYLSCIGIILLWLAVSEARYKMAFKKWWAGWRKGNGPQRFDYYMSSIPWAMGIVLAIVLVIVMILSWNDPI